MYHILLAPGSLSESDLRLMAALRTERKRPQVYTMSHGYFDIVTTSKEAFLGIGALSSDLRDTVLVRVDRTFNENPDEQNVVFSILHEGDERPKGLLFTRSQNDDRVIFHVFPAH